MEHLLGIASGEPICGVCFDIVADYSVWDSCTIYIDPGENKY
jgi:hypothetical protein